MSNELTSPIGRVAFPHLSKARQMNKEAKFKFSVTIVWDENVDLSKIREVVDALIKEKYPKRVPENFRYPLRDGTTKIDKETGEQLEGFAETDTYADFWKYEEKGTVPVVDAQRNDLLPGDVYAGMLGRVLFRPFLYDVSGNVGAGFGLEAVQKSGDGEAIGYAPVNPQTAFGALEETENLSSILD